MAELRSLTLKSKGTGRPSEAVRMAVEQERRDAAQKPRFAELHLHGAIVTDDIAEVKEWLACEALMAPEKYPEDSHFWVTRKYIVQEAIRTAAKLNRTEIFMALVELAKKENLHWDIDMLTDRGGWVEPLTNTPAKFGNEEMARFLAEEGAKLSPASLFILLYKENPENRHVSIARHYLDAGVDAHEKYERKPLSDFTAALAATPIGRVYGIGYRPPTISAYDRAKTMRDNPVAQAIIQHVRAQRPTFAQRVGRVLKPQVA